ncbi:Chaperonin 60 [Giardia muris]|uniref:Chaperonin 60 n=1 Tax=Giardia muris TaxID=5742 RepID=A0A4Z1T3K4_GIAMU|nr:Chaperonin 60 [Giardia muris]|eukprot:TNJ30228.1 Chaperonin 60 [Giardia muris]
MLTQTTDVLFGGVARGALQRGAAALARAVGSTLGPQGRTVLIANGGQMRVTKDGVSVARTIHLAGPEGLGSTLVADAALRANTVVGDGTTTSVILAAELGRRLEEKLSLGVSLRELLQSTRSAIQEAITYIRGLSVPVKTHDRLRDVATVACNGDQKMGGLVAKAFAEVGESGAVSVEEGYELQDVLVTAAGCQLQGGWASAYFTQGGQVTLENPLVFLSDSVIREGEVLVPALESALAAKRPLLVLAADVTGDALATLIVNNLRGTVRCCAARLPGYGELRKGVAGDLAAVTGVKGYISSEAGLDQTTALGSCRRVTVSKDHTTIYISEEDESTKSRVSARIAALREELSEARSSYQQEKITERIGRLLGKVCTIRVGALTEIEAGERRDRYIDAISAAKAARMEGIVPGGGFSLVRAASHLRKTAAGFTDEAKRAAYQAVADALCQPLRRLAENAGRNGDTVVNEVIRTGLGFDAQTFKYDNLLERGVVDPTRVVVTALESAASAAITLLSTDALVLDKEQEK